MGQVKYVSSIGHNAESKLTAILDGLSTRSYIHIPIRNVTNGLIRPTDRRITADPAKGRALRGHSSRILSKTQRAETSNLGTDGKISRIKNLTQVRGKTLKADRKMRKVALIHKNAILTKCLKPSPLMPHESTLTFRHRIKMVTEYPRQGRFQLSLQY
jgi:hypothetical protein